VAILDLDHFKRYNDTHGHQGGDRLLKETAAAWRATIRVTDLLARYGGEEFALLAPPAPWRTPASWPTGSARRAAATATSSPELA
jgi:diguanylate cyclase (GGDEF)-like protein